MAMPRPISVTTGWAKKCTGITSARSRMIPSAPAIVRPPTIAGRLAATTPPKTKNSTTATSGIASTSPRFWSSPMVPVSSLASGCRPASLTSTPSIGEVVLDLLEVVQDGVVVVALELDRHERVLLVPVGHVRQRLGALEVADRAQDFVGVVPFDLGQIVENLLLEFRVVDGLALGSGVERDDVARRVAAVHLVGEPRRLRRLAAVVVEAALGDVLPRLMPKMPPPRHSATMTPITMYRYRYTVRPHQANT